MGAHPLRNAAIGAITLLMLLGGLSACLRTQLKGWAEPPMAAGPWQPADTALWRDQVTGEADVYLLDAFTTNAETVDWLHSIGRRVVCRIDAGVWDPATPDAARVPPRLLGSSIDGVHSGRWLDIRQRAVLQPVLRDRVALCRDKGFDAVAAGHLDAYGHPTGFQVTESDQQSYVSQLAVLVHAAGMRLGAAQGVTGADFTAPVP
jgi:hypothetical protein